MTKVKLNLASGSVQEREVITAFKNNDVKYIIFDGESTGSMGLPIILVCKEVLGKVVGITEADEWKNTKECLKKIISGDKIEYAGVSSELKADDIYYRQLTLPVSSFDVLKSSYVAPEVIEQSGAAVDNSPVFEPIAPEDITKSDISSINPVSADSFNSSADASSMQYNNVISNVNSEIPSPVVEAAPAIDANVAAPSVSENINASEVNTSDVSNQVENQNTLDYDTLKADFLKAAEALFDDLYKKINHND